MLLSKIEYKLDDKVVTQEKARIDGLYTKHFLDSDDQEIKIEHYVDNYLVKVSYKAENNSQDVLVKQHLQEYKNIPIEIKEPTVEISTKLRQYRSTLFSGEGKFGSNIKATVDVNDVILSIEDYDRDNQLLSVEYYMYDSNGELWKILQKDASGNVIAEEEMD